jgi:photosystem II stability/assembly factor-like uncharacterized protein
VTTIKEAIFEEFRLMDPERSRSQVEQHQAAEQVNERMLATILASGRLEPIEDARSRRLVVSLFDSRRAGHRRKEEGSEYAIFKRSPSRWLVPALMSVVVILAVTAVSISLSANVGKPHASLPVKPPTPWRLAAMLSGPQFQLASGNPNLIAGATCTTHSLCFLSTGYGLDYNGGGALYVSRDGGHTWQQTHLPADTAIVTKVSCASSSWCVAGAGHLDASLGDPLAKKPMRAPEILVTTDGGQTWTAESVPLPVDVQQIPAGGGFPAETTYWPGAVDAVICNAPESCQVLGQSQVDNPSGNGIADRLFYLGTADGGRHWSSTQLPERPNELAAQIALQAGTTVSMDCSSVNACVVVASLVSFTSSPPNAFDAWSTANAGKTWQENPVPGAQYLTAPISCPNAGNCWLMVGTGNHVLHSTDGGATWTAISLPPGGWDGVSCSTDTKCWVSGTSIAETSDGGAHWLVEQLPTHVGNVPQISCNALGDCVATAIPANSGVTVENEGSLILTNTPMKPSQ